MGTVRINPVNDLGGVRQVKAGALADRPAAAAMPEGYYVRTDGPQTYYSDGLSWSEKGGTPTDGSVTRAKMSQTNRGLIICTSTTRPTGTDAPEGQHIYETDTDQTLKNTGTPAAPAWSALGGGGGASGPPKGHLIGGAQRWDSGIAYSVEPGEALVNGTLLSWSAAISRTNLALTASSIHYVYLYPNAGTPALLESTTAPLWDVALGYFKLGGASPDASRRCVGFVRTDGTGNLYRFFSTAVGRTREWFILFPNTADISASSVVSGGTSTAAWASLSLASFVPAHATHFFAAAKIAFAATSDDGILGLAPVDLGTSAAFAAPYTVRDSAPKASTKTFFGRVWAPIGANSSVFYRLQIIAGSPTAEVECHGARFVA